MIQGRCVFRLKPFLDAVKAAGHGYWDVRGLLGKAAVGHRHCATATAHRGSLSGPLGAVHTPIANSLSQVKVSSALLLLQAEFSPSWQMGLPV